MKAGSNDADIGLSGRTRSLLNDQLLWPVYTTYDLINIFSVNQIRIRILINYQKLLRMNNAIVYDDVRERVMASRSHLALNMTSQYQRGENNFHY